MYSSGILTGGNRHTWSVAAIAGIRQGRLPRHTWSGCLLPRHLKHALDGTFLAHVSWPIGCYVIVRIVRLPRSRPRRACIRNTFLMLGIMRAGFLDLTLGAAASGGFTIEFLSWHDNTSACSLPESATQFRLFFRHRPDVSIEAIQSLLGGCPVSGKASYRGDAPTLSMRRVFPIQIAPAMRTSPWMSLTG